MPRSNRVASIIVALAISTVTAFAADICLSSFGSGLSRGSSTTRLLFYLSAAYVSFQCGRAYIRLGYAPVYPRSRYYGSADIAPESPAAERTERKWMIFGLAAAAIGVVTLTLAELGLQLATPISGAALALGVTFQGSAAWTALERDRVLKLEETLRGKNILYLRSFRGARSWLVVATAAAAAPFRVVAILSPRRLESRSLYWYILAAFFPTKFNRISFWSTTEVDWHRVAASCMNSSRSIVLDCYGAPDDLSRTEGSGLILEIGMSLGFGAKHATAYVTEISRTLPVGIPPPCILQTSGQPWWVMRHFAALVARLRCVLNRQLSVPELAYLDAFYADLQASWQEAMIRDRNLASRENRPDPHELLMSRNPMSELRKDSTATQSEQ
jgi:hypothetical protein